MPTLDRSILIDMVRELEQHFGYLPDRYLQFFRVQIISSRDHSVMMADDSIMDSIRSHRLCVCAILYHLTVGRRMMGTRSFHSRSRCLVLPLLICRLDPSPLLSRRQSLGRRSWVGAPLLVWVAFLFFVPSTVPTPISCESLLSRPSVALGVSSVSSGSEGCVPRLPAF